MNNSPSHWLKLLQERIGIISSFKQGLTDEEFDALCYDEPRFHQDVLLELRDLTAIAGHFTQAVKKQTVF